MKTALIFLSTLIITIQAAVINNPEDELRKTTFCLRHSGVSSEIIRALQTGNFENDQRLKEYFLCVNKNFGIQDELGYLQSDIIRAKLKGGHYSDDTINDVIESCTQQKETPQETAFQFIKCVYANTMPKKYSRNTRKFSTRV